MKTQMRFQKILCLVSLVLSAVAIVYAFAFFTGGLATISDLYLGGFSGSFEGVAELYVLANTVNDLLLILGIVYLLIVAFMYIFACNKRRNYYKDSVVMSIVAAAYIFVYGLAVIILAAVTHASFSAIDFVEIFDLIDTSTLSHSSQSPVMFVLGYIFGVIALANAAAIAFNLIWKLKLMKGEKELLANGLVKEVA